MNCPNYWSASTDGNQADIVKVLRDLGCHVLPIHRIKNACDLIVSYRGYCCAVEVKKGNAKLTEGEMKFKDEFQGPYFICRSVDDAHLIFNEIRAEVEK